MASYPSAGRDSKHGLPENRQVNLPDRGSTRYYHMSNDDDSSTLYLVVFQWTYCHGAVEMTRLSFFRF